MKKATLLGFLILLCSVTFAQTVSVSGTVTDQKGNPVPFAFISDSQLTQGTFSNISGVFYIKVKPATTLVFTAAYHQKAETKIDNPGDIKVTMPLDSTKGAPVVDPKAKNIFVQDESLVNTFITSSDIKGTGQEALHGSRYLFPDWVHGFAVAPGDSIKQNDLYLFNYDKMSGNLIFTRNKTNTFTINKGDAKSFTLFDDAGQSYLFESVPAIDKKFYVEVIAADKKYKIYKNLGTKFIKSNYFTDGIRTEGHNYDEYADESEYYAVKLPDGAPIKFTFKSKSIKLAFAADADKVKKYLSDNDKDIDEDYLKGLMDYLDQ